MTNQGKAGAVSLVRPGEVWWNPLVLAQHDPIITLPAKAPRLLEVLRGAFMPWIDKPQPVLMRPGWLVRPSNPDEKLVHDWHKDSDHTGVTSVHGYTYPPWNPRHLDKKAWKMDTAL